MLPPSLSLLITTGTSS